MKTAIVISPIAAVVALMSPTTAVAMRSSPDAEFERAMKKGAQARLEIRVVDDEGEPVSNATVKVLFNILTPGGGEIVTVTTDTNGVAVAEGKTNDAIRYRVEKEGYYKSEDGMDMYNMSHRYEVKGGRWQPWGMQKEIVLRPVRNPAAIRMPVNNWRYVIDMYKWIGFDLQKYDFLPPHGKGEFADLELRIDWNGKRFKGYEGIDPFHDHAGRHRACARRSPAQVHLARVPYALTGNGWLGGPQHAPGQAPSAPRRVAAHCRGKAGRAVAHPQNRLQMARPARRSRGARVICNPWLRLPLVAAWRIFLYNIL